MTLTQLVVRYSAFAVVATIVNLAVQRLCLMGTDGTWALPLAIGVGTIAGLVVKYVLDKRWIFADLSSGAKVHARQFGMYSLMGVATTAIFWGMEYGFWVAWGTHAMRELGAVLGLAIGYVVKYQLDKRLVFTSVTDRVGTPA